MQNFFSLFTSKHTQKHARRPTLCLFFVFTEDWCGLLIRQLAAAAFPKPSGDEAEEEEKEGEDKMGADAADPTVCSGIYISG